jgi:3-oxoacyl-[acyl-carrier protein] reductase
MVLYNKIVIVTGGTKGIGGNLTLSFAKAGAIVYAIYHKDDQNAKEFKKSIDKKGLTTNIIVKKSSITDFNSFKKLILNIKRTHNKIDILVNNAGVFYNGYFSMMKIYECDSLIDTNIKGTIYASYIVSRLMIPQKSGIIINISSITAFKNFKGVAVYSASKAAITSFSKNLAIELDPLNIKVFCVAPSLAKTEMTKSIQQSVINTYKDTEGKLLTLNKISQKVIDLCTSKYSVLKGETICIGFNN